MKPLKLGQIFRSVRQCKITKSHAKPGRIARAKKFPCVLINWITVCSRVPRRRRIRPQTFTNAGAWVFKTTPVPRVFGVAHAFYWTFDDDFYDELHQLSRKLDR